MPEDTIHSNQEPARKSGHYGQEEIAASHLEYWPNPSPDRPYTIDLSIPEFTCLCPQSGFPDFATINIDYTPQDSVVELKSLKLYINQFRDQALSHEETPNRILDDLVALLHPRRMHVTALFNVRGNISATVSAAYTSTSSSYSDGKWSSYSSIY
jgi:7-cyano-7-deazaguanine reductase